MADRNGHKCSTDMQAKYHMFLWQREIDGWPAPALETTIFFNNFKRFIVFVSSFFSSSFCVAFFIILAAAAVC